MIRPLNIHIKGDIMDINNIELSEVKKIFV